MEKSEKRFWTVVALVFVGILAWQITASIMPALGRAVKALTPFLFAFVTAYLLRHPVAIFDKFLAMISKRQYKRWHHTVSTIVVLVLFLGFLVIMIAILVPNVINNITDIVIALPSFIESAKSWLTEKLLDASQWLNIDVNTYAMDFIGNIGTNAIDSVHALSGHNVLATATGALSGTMKFVVDMVMYIFSSFFLLHDYEKLKKNIRRSLKLFIHSDTAYTKTCSLLHVSDKTIEKYIVVKLTTSFCLGIVGYIGFKLFGLPYAILLATIVAVTNIVPYIGPIVGAIPAILVGLASVNFKTGIWVALFILICQQIEGNILTPILTGGALKISPIFVLAGIAVFGAMMGIPGMILGAPIAGIIGGIVRNGLKEAETLNGIEETDNDIK